ncbi:PP2C family protein-serine/threonine phosphatase [Sphingomonas sp. Tas61C01]|uniref:PP2C family protein-serine/threonine phosphatase n=1 Tax=Sphingomonas sp. Tas61C01 TaxID=3458297 RepID=UPI00403E5C9E
MRRAILPRWARFAASTTPVMTNRFRSAARTHVGRVRSINEDRLLDRADRGLWVIADGMGGHHAGAAAATTAVETLARLADRTGQITRPDLLAAIREANSAIHAGSTADAGTSGATIVAITVIDDRATICWAGDSRAYRIRAGMAERLTRDHSLVQELVDAGVLAEAAAERHPRANVVTRALGVAATVEIDVAAVTLVPGDRLLLCSDGISRSLHPRDFATMPVAIDACADRLLANALQRDGSDNATLILVDLAGAAIS